MNRKKQTAAWMAIVAFSAFSAAAVAADGDSIRSKSRTEQPGESSAPGEQRTNGSGSGSGTMDSRSSPARETAASFARIDRDSNGAIDASEATDAGIDLIGADRDSNGILTATEFEAALGHSGDRSAEDRS